MPRPKIIEETSISMADLKSELSKIKKRDKELSFRANKTMEYLGQFSSIDAKNAKDLYDKIDKLGIPRIKDVHINKIVDLLPKSVEDLKVVLQGYPITVKKEDMEKIVKAVSSFS